MGRGAPSVNYLERRRTHFILWSPAALSPAPKLVIGTFEAGTPPALAGRRELVLRPSAEAEGQVFELPAAECGLEEGRVYHYWFLVNDSNAYRAPEHRAAVLCTDPGAESVDWRLLSLIPPNYGESDRQPAGVVLFANGRLEPADP